MSNSSAVLAFDLGASGGRALGEITSADHESPGMLKITEIHRFANIPVQMGQHLHWNFPMPPRRLSMASAKRSKPAISRSAMASIHGASIMD